MIIDRVEDAVKYLGISPMLDQALMRLPDFIKRFNVHERMEANEDYLYANSMQYLTSCDPERLFEAHRRYVDIHVLMSGEEAVDVAFLSEAAEWKGYDPEIDAVLYRAEPKISMILRPGFFVIFFPNEIHRAGRDTGGARNVSKFVIKALWSDTVS